MAAIGLGLLSSLFWGTGDFLGGMVSRRLGAKRSIFFIEVLGLILLLVLFFFIPEPFFGWKNFFTAFFAGSIGTVGLIVLYHAMSVGLMSVAAPVSALLAALLPVLVSVSTEGIPGPLALVGFLLAFLSVWFISQDGDKGFHLGRFSDLKWPLIAGLGFGMYFIFIHRASGNSVLWPLIAGRIGGSVVIILILLYSRTSLRTPDPKPWALIGGNASFDVLGNTFFILAGQLGRLDIATIMSSLYPLATVGLAWLVLKEKLNKRQWLGIVLAITAIILLTIYSNSV